MGIGICFMIIGACIIFYGVTINNDMDAQMESLFNNGTTNPGSNCIMIGAFLVFIGLVFFIIGIVLYIQKKNGYQNPNALQNSSPADKCQNCGSPIFPETEYCSQCGMKISLPPKKFCRHCGKAIDVAAVFCPYCGKQINTQ